MNGPTINATHYEPDVAALQSKLQAEFPDVPLALILISMTNAANTATLESLLKIAPHPVLAHAFEIVAGNYGALTRMVGENLGVSVETLTALIDAALKQADEQIALTRQMHKAAGAAVMGEPVAAQDEKSRIVLH